MTPRVVRLSIGLVCGLMLSAVVPGETQNAIANGDTRTIHLYHTHTGESISATFRVDGQYDPSALKKLNWFLRDWRTDEPTTMSPKLFDVIWETYRETGSRQPIHVVSAFRSPKTNAMLRRRSRAVAEHSQHMLGKAMDMHYVDVPMSKVREIAMRLQRGGVGYYPTSGTPFVHLDVGSVRAWPRMSYDQLARLFPDGKTVHLPTNGHPLARYDEARAEIDARGDAPLRVASAYAPQQRGFFSRLFNAGAEEEEDTGATPAARGRSRLARATTVDKDDAPEITTPAQRRAQDQIARAERNLPRGETGLSAGGSAPQPVAPVQVAAIPVTTAQLPSPPRRPADIGAPPPAVVALADAPLPPSRPASLVAALQAPPALPDVIRNGAETRPESALAYVMAASTSVEADQTGARAGSPVRALGDNRPRLAPARKIQLVAARLDQSNFAMLSSPAAVAQAMPLSGLGVTPNVRASAKSEARAQALSPHAQIAGGFGASATDLRVDAFTGPAVRPVVARGIAQDEQGRVGLAALASLAR